jgi:uncharacterized membrane protein YhfC
MYNICLENICLKNLVFKNQRKICPKYVHMYVCNKNESRLTVQFNAIFIKKFFFLISEAEGRIRVYKYFRPLLARGLKILSSR